jgi:hypothetical protein
VTALPGRLRVAIGGQLFTAYNFTGASRPYFYPILAPDGTALTRDFPMKDDTPGEDHDHPWHRALFFAHSIVNDVDFWNEGTGDNGRTPAAKGRVVQDGEAETSGGRMGLIRVRDRWLAPDGRLVCTDERTLLIHGSADGRFIDVAIALHARPDRPLHLGDNKDGTMAIRVPQWMTLRHTTDGRTSGGSGHIQDAVGDRDDAVWGRRADWCDYYGPHGGQIYGIAIFDDPGNLRHPTWWMARGFGLFAANPFGQHDFEKLADAHAGDFTIPAGGVLTLRYRFFFHAGDTATARVADHYAAFADRP